MSAKIKAAAKKFNAFPITAHDEREITLSTGRKFTGLYAVLVITVTVLFAIFTAATMGDGVQMKTEPAAYVPGDAESEKGVTFERIKELQKNHEDVKCYASNTSPIRKKFSTVNWELDSVCQALFNFYDPQEQCNADASPKDNKYFCFDQMSWDNIGKTADQKKSFYLGTDMVRTMRVIDMFSIACKKAKTVTTGISTGIMAKSVSNPTILPESVVKASLDADAAMAEGSFPALFGTSFITPVMWYAFNGPMVVVDNDNNKQANMLVVPSEEDDRDLPGRYENPAYPQGNAPLPGYDRYLAFFERNMQKWKADWTSAEQQGAMDQDYPEKAPAWKNLLTTMSKSKFNSFGDGLDSMFVSGTKVELKYEDYVKEADVTHCTYIVPNEVSVFGVIAAVLGIFAGLNTFIKSVVSQLVDKQIKKLEKQELESVESDKKSAVAPASDGGEAAVA